MKPPFEDYIKMELVSPSNRLRLAWYVLIGRAISVGYFVNIYKKITP